MELRRSMAEAGLHYEATEAAFKKGDIRKQLEAANTSAEDIEQIVKLVEDHFKLGTGTSFMKTSSSKSLRSCCQAQVQIQIKSRSISGPFQIYFKSFQSISIQNQMIWIRS